jgi:hypothetical protein
MASYEDKIIELERRLQKLEREVFGRSKVTEKPSVLAQSPPKLEELKIPNETLSALRERIRKVSYMNLILILLDFSPRSLTYSDMMILSKELKKPVSYEWLNTEFHRTKYSGLVRSESIPSSKEKTYSLNEPGRKRAEIVLARLKASKEVS